MVELVKQKILEKNRFVGSEKNKEDDYQFFSSTSLETISGDIHIHLVIKDTRRFSDFIVLRNYLLIVNRE